MQLDSIIIFPGDAPSTLVNASGSHPIPIRLAHGYDRFAEALAGSVAAQVRVDEGLELPPPADGVIFICRPDILDRSLVRQADQAEALAARTLVVDLVRSYALRWAERLSLAGVIESEQYFQWLEGRYGGHLGTFYGLKSVAETLGATWRQLPGMEGPRYAALSHPQLRELPAFLGAYLDTYAALL